MEKCKNPGCNRPAEKRSPHQYQGYCSFECRDTDRIAQLEAENEALMKGNEAKNTVLTHYEIEFDKLQKENARMKNELNLSNEDSMNKTVGLKMLRKENARLKAENAELRQKLKENEEEFYSMVKQAEKNAKIADNLLQCNKRLVEAGEMLYGVVSQVSRSRTASVGALHNAYSPGPISRTNVDNSISAWYDVLNKRLPDGDGERELPDGYMEDVLGNVVSGEEQVDKLVEALREIKDIPIYMGDRGLWFATATAYEALEEYEMATCEEGKRADKAHTGYSYDDVKFTWKTIELNKLAAECLGWEWVEVVIDENPPEGYSGVVEGWIPKGFVPNVSTNIVIDGELKPIVKLGDWGPCNDLNQAAMLEKKVREEKKDSLYYVSIKEIVDSEMTGRHTRISDYVMASARVRTQAALMALSWESE